MKTIESGGITYVVISQEFYDTLIAAQDENEGARFKAVENFRVWCAANKGTTTVEEGLRACTVEELAAQIYAAGGYSGGCIGAFINVLRGRLLSREKAKEEALESFGVTPIMPDEEGE